MAIPESPPLGMVLASVDPYDLSGVMPRGCHAYGWVGAEGVFVNGSGAQVIQDGTAGLRLNRGGVGAGGGRHWVGARSTGAEVINSVFDIRNGFPFGSIT